MIMMVMMMIMIIMMIGDSEGENIIYERGHLRCISPSWQLSSFDVASQLVFFVLPEWSLSQKVEINPNYYLLWAQNVKLKEIQQLSKGDICR